MTSTLPPIVQAFSGSIGSASAGALTYPLDLVSTRLQLKDPNDKRRKGGLHDGIRILHYTIQKNGVSALYDGLVTDTVAKALSNFLYFYFYTWLRGLSTHRYLSLGSLMGRHSSKPQSPHKPGMAEEVLLGFLAGVASRAISTPLNIVTLRLQTEREDEDEGQPKALHSTGIVNVVKSMYKEHGLAGFWRDDGNPFLESVYHLGNLSNVQKGSYIMADTPKTSQTKYIPSKYSSQPLSTGGIRRRGDLEFHCSRNFIPYHSSEDAITELIGSIANGGAYGRL
ncbi:hypothetical protein D9756_005699 [Leucocoprinus leucothites]|uniref:Mitochondrial carrier protein n=1 Tax=Leucocoprinus leucothites TaxID=201217 RepID=A0A8H5G0A2_9AGAR|nr:hypothetical protein D9756_005699 [Leucoagaricus leucothites]